jgi:hypothetical protein
MPACLWQNLSTISTLRVGRRQAPLHRETAIAEAICQF